MSWCVWVHKGGCEKWVCRLLFVSLPGERLPLEQARCFPALPQGFSQASSEQTSGLRQLADLSSASLRYEAQCWTIPNTLTGKCPDQFQGGGAPGALTSHGPLLSGHDTGPARWEGTLLLRGT